MVEGQSVEIGPFNVRCTACRLVGPGTEQNKCAPANSVGIVSVTACVGTAANEAKHPSFTCCCRQASSSATGLIVCGSSKSATGGSLNAMCPFSPIPRHTMSI